MATSHLDIQAIHEKERLYNFLKKYDLHKYYEKFLLKGVHRLSHLKDVSVDESSLDEIGLTRIERQRLKKKVRENVAWRGKFVKKITGRVGQFNAPIPSIPVKQEPQNRRSAAIIPNDEIKLIRKIGEGAHGAVHEGTWADAHGAVAVAVKTLYGKQEVQNMFIKEANSMSTLNHKHIIQLYGIVLSPSLKLIEELAQFGSLHSYMQKEGKHLSLQLFHVYASQIADAMSYLEKRRIVHRDLAIRNVLLAHVDHVKLSDFGMARVLDENCDVYNLSNLATRIPVAWTALEALTFAKFSPASDVWSFGVSLWEIYSLGDVPWKGLPPMEIKDVLIAGERLGCPVRCPTDVYELIRTCWKDDPQMRPTFAEIYQQLQLLVPKQVRGVKTHHVTDDPGSLSFKAGELIYIIDKPNLEWTRGMKTEGSFGHFRSEYVTNILNPISEIRARLASGKTTVSSISIGSPTSVDHMVHVDQDGTKFTSENFDAVFDPTPPPSPDQSLRDFDPTSSTPPPFRVVDVRSPSPKDPPFSPLLQGVSAPSPDPNRSKSPPRHQQYISNLVDITTRRSDVIDNIDLGSDMPDQYITINQSATFIPENEKTPEEEDNEPPSDFADKYVIMQSYSVKRVMDDNERRPQYPLSIEPLHTTTKRRSATVSTNGELSMYLGGGGRGSDVQDIDKSANDGIDSEVTTRIPLHYDKPRSFTMNRSHYDVPSSSLQTSSNNKTMTLLDSSIGSVHLQQPLMPAKPRRPLSESFASPSSSPSSMHRKGSDDLSPKRINHVPLYIPEDGTPGQVQKMEGSPYVPKSTRSIYSESSSDNQISMSLSAFPVPKPRTGAKGVNGIANEMETTRGNSEEMTTSSQLPPGCLARPVPPPRPVPLPRRSNSTKTNQRGGDSDYQPINLETRFQHDESQYMILSPKTKTGNSQKNSNKASPEKPSNPTPNREAAEFAEGKLQLILSDDEFVGCEIEICKFALEQENFDVEKAKEEIRVQILLGMLLPNIREEDCRKALVHCQHKTNRAATWLIQLSTDMQEKIQ